MELVGLCVGFSYIAYLSAQIAIKLYIRNENGKCYEVAVSLPPFSTL